MSGQIKSAEELLRIREARVLRVPIVVRIVFSLFGLGSAFTVTMPVTARVVVCVVAVGTIAANLSFLRLLRDVRNVDLVGYTGVSIDVVGLALYPFILYQTVAQYSLPPASISSSFVTVVVCITIMVINSLALRPMYPIIVTAGAIAVHLGILIIAIVDPRTVWATSDVDIWTGPTASLALIINEMIFLVIIGAALVMITRGARKVVLEAVELEEEKFRTHREQAILLMEGKIGALGKLVAGVSHEINTPLAVVKCNAEASRPALSRIRKGLEQAAASGHVDVKIERVLSALEQNDHNNLSATERIESTLETLRSFARLDEAEFQQTNIHINLDSTLALIPAKTIGGARTVKQYGDVPEIQCYAGRLNQVFMTLLTNAFEAIEGEGSVTIATWKDGDQVFIRITDTGRGIPPHQVDQLFDIGFQAKQSRVAAGLGLAASHSIVSQHGGEIGVESEAGKGTTFTVLLPVR
jgi:signal transduction histidine kinase